MKFLPASSFLIFLLVSSVTLANFAYAQKIIDADGDGIADDSRGNHASRSLQITVTVKESGQ